jgi:hypothetical protein
MDSISCARRHLSSGDFSLIEQCSCGSVHVTIGAITLRIAPAALTDLAGVLAHAAQKLTAPERVGLRLVSDEVLS